MHSWDVTPSEAVNIQLSLSEKVILKKPDFQFNLIGGADISYNKYSNLAYAGIIIFEFPTLKEITRSYEISEINFPYIPGLLSFREIPILIKVWEKLNIKPHIMIFDGQGIAHPRRLGIASHFGIWYDIPTIGCAKSLLIGQYSEPRLKKGSKAFIYYKNEKIGVALRTRSNVKPVFISPGHKIDFITSVNIVMNCITKYRLPETTRLAHNFVNQLRLNKPVN